MTTPINPVPVPSHVAGQTTAAVRGAIPDAIAGVATLVSAAGLPADQQHIVVKGVIDHLLMILGGIGDVAQPEFASIIDAGVKRAVAFIDNAGGEPTSAADIAAATRAQESAFEATQINSVDPLAPKPPAGGAA